MATEQRKAEAKQGQGQAPEQARPKADPHRVQTRFLLSIKGRAVELRFTNGDRLECTMIAADQFSILCRLTDGQQVLVYKSGLAGITRREEGAGEGGENGETGKP